MQIDNSRRQPQSWKIRPTLRIKITSKMMITENIKITNPNYENDPKENDNLKNEEEPQKWTWSENQYDLKNEEKIKNWNNKKQTSSKSRCVCEEGYWGRVAKHVFIQKNFPTLNFYQCQNVFWTQYFFTPKTFFRPKMNFNENHLWKEKIMLLNLRFSKLIWVMVLF